MTAAYVWTTLMPGVYAPLFLGCKPVPSASAARPSRNRPAWFPKRIVRDGRRPPMRRYRLVDARLLPY